MTNHSSQKLTIFAIFSFTRDLLGRLREKRPSLIVAKLTGKFSEDNKTSELARFFILEAYKTPKFDDDKLKVKAVDEFANRLALECYSTTIVLQ